MHGIPLGFFLPSIFKQLTASIIYLKVTPG